MIRAIFLLSISFLNCSFFSFGQAVKKLIDLFGLCDHGFNNEVDELKERISSVGIVTNINLPRMDRLIANDGGAAGSLGTLDFPLPPIDHNAERSDDTAPKAYLNYIFMDREMNESSRRAAAWQITTKGAEHGQDGRHDFLSLTFEAKEAGFLYIYVSNDNPQPVELYFDDFKVTQTKSPVVQQDDYYPFGLTYNSYTRENSVDQRYKFQGQEHIDALDLGWDAFKWRNHQPDIGRFFNIDPLAHKYVYNSPYAFSENKVVAHVELEGLESAEYALKQEIGKVKTALNQMLTSFKNGLSSVGSAIKDGFMSIGNFPKQKSGEGGQQKGFGVNIYDEGKGQPGNDYLPKPDQKAKNVDLPKDVLDAMGAASEDLKAPARNPDIGQRAENFANGVDKTKGAVDAAKEVLKKDEKKQDKIPDYVTQDSVKHEVGDSTYYTKNKKIRR